jgi:hypothetical protein
MRPCRRGGTLDASAVPTDLPLETDMAAIDRVAQHHTSSLDLEEVAAMEASSPTHNPHRQPPAAACKVSGGLKDGV